MTIGNSICVAITKQLRQAFCYSAPVELNLSNLTNLHQDGISIYGNSGGLCLGRPETMSIRLADGLPRLSISNSACLAQRSQVTAETVATTFGSLLQHSFNHITIIRCDLLLLWRSQYFVLISKIYHMSWLQNNVSVRLGHFLKVQTSYPINQV